MNDIEDKCLCIFDEIAQILHDVIMHNAQILDFVKNLTISQKLQNSYNIYIFPDNWHYLVNNSNKIVTKGGYISDKKLQNGNKIVCGYNIPNTTNHFKFINKKFTNNILTNILIYYIIYNRKILKNSLKIIIFKNEFFVQISPL